jgi:hypothetical protein
MLLHTCTHLQVHTVSRHATPVDIVGRTWSLDVTAVRWFLQCNQWRPRFLLAIPFVPQISRPPPGCSIVCKSVSPSCVATHFSLAAAFQHGCEKSMKLILLEKPIVAQLVKKFLNFYWTRRFITVFTRTRHPSLSWIRWIQSTNVSSKTNVNIILPSTPRSLKWPQLPTKRNGRLKNK